MLSVRCLSVLSVTLVYYGQTVEWNKTKLGMVVGLGPGHIVSDGDLLPLQKRGTAFLQFSAHVHCGQTAGWIKMPLGMAVGFGPGDIVRWGPAPRQKAGHNLPTNFWRMFIVAKRSPISATAELLLVLRLLLWPPYVIRGPLYFCTVIYIFFFYLLFLPRLISAVAGWMSTILWHMVWP